MAFTPANQGTRSFTRITRPHFAVVKTPSMHVGRVTLPRDLIKELEWAPNTNLVVLVGDEEDTGWYQLKPLPADSEVRHRAKLKVAGNGVGQYATNALVPPNTTGPVHTFKPDFKVDAESLWLKLF